MAQQQTIATRAAASGFTVPVNVDAGIYDLEGFVRPGTDYDDRFTMICGETGDTLRVNGWTCGQVRELV